MVKRSVATLRGSVRLSARSLSDNGPSVCLLYESEEERLELSRRLRKAGLDEIPWESVDLGSRSVASAYLDPVRRLSRHLVDVLGTGSVATVTVLAAYWPLVAAVTLWIAPVFIVLRLVRGSSPPAVAVTA